MIKAGWHLFTLIESDKAS